MKTGHQNSQDNIKKLKKLNIKSMEHLGLLLGSSPSELKKIAENSNKYFRTRELIKNNKKRQLAIPNSRLMLLLKNLNQLLQRVELPSYVFGGVRGRSNLDNALQHNRKPVILKADIQDFFPSIDTERIRAVFRNRLGCSEKVAETLARITTFEGRLPQGSPTSTVLANFAIEHLAYRLHELAKKHDSEYTQFVDDITISGPKHLVEIKETVRKIIEGEGFISHPMKLCIQKDNEEHVVTGVRINQGKDIPKRKMLDINQQINDLREEILCGKTITSQKVRSIEGKIRYYARLNPGSAKYLARQFKSVLQLNHKILRGPYDNQR